MGLKEESREGGSRTGKSNPFTHFGDFSDVVVGRHPGLIWRSPKLSPGQLIQETQKKSLSAPPKAANKNKARLISRGLDKLFK